MVFHFVQDTKARLADPYPVRSFPASKTKTRRTDAHNPSTDNLILVPRNRDRPPALLCSIHTNEALINSEFGLYLSFGRQSRAQPQPSSSSKRNWAASTLGKNEHKMFVRGPVLRAMLHVVPFCVSIHQSGICIRIRHHSNPYPSTSICSRHLLLTKRRGVSVVRSCGQYEARSVESYE